MNEIVSIIIIVFGILQVILFFKIWGMTNDIREMKNKYMNEESNSSDFVEDFVEDLNLGLLVIDLKTEKQMRLGDKLANGKYKCYSNNTYVGDFSPSEFMEFDKWVKEVYKKQ